MNDIKEIASRVLAATLIHDLAEKHKISLSESGQFVAKSTKDETKVFDFLEALTKEGYKRTREGDTVFGYTKGKSYVEVNYRMGSSGKLAITQTR